MVSGAVLLHSALNQFLILVGPCLKIWGVRELGMVYCVVIIFVSQLCLMAEVEGLGVLVAEIPVAKVMEVVVKGVKAAVVNGPYSPGKDWFFIMHQFDSGLR